MSKRKTRSTPVSDRFATFIGIDWADQAHTIATIDDDKKAPEITLLRHTPKNVAEWAEAVRKKYDGRPIAVAIETTRGPLINMLVQYPHLVIFPINPKCASNYREALSPAGTKDDVADATLLARYVQMHHHVLRTLQPDGVETRKLANFCLVRRKIVDLRKKNVQKVLAMLKEYMPPELIKLLGNPRGKLAIGLLRRWPSLGELKRAKPTHLHKALRECGHIDKEINDGIIRAIRAMTPLTTDPAIVEPYAMYVKSLIIQIADQNKQVDEFDTTIGSLLIAHEKAPLAKSLPGAGAALAPRIVAAMGDDPNRFADAVELQNYTGQSPVTRSSGKSRVVQRRRAAPNFVRQTFHEFAEQARRYSTWSMAYYDELRARGVKHHAAVRALAFKWMRIIYRMWQTGKLYDEEHYIACLVRRNSPLSARLRKMRIG